MTESLHRVRFPGESDEYRAARNELLRAELDLRERIEAVAALRRRLPRGGRVKEDYVFDELADGSKRKVPLSALFAPDKSSLVVYSFMYGPDAPRPCPMCTSFLDGLDRAARHVTRRLNLAVVAKSPIERIRAWADERGWERLRLLSSHGNRYNADYFAEDPDGGQLPACNVFTRTADGISHFWSAETLYVPLEGHPRHLDLLWPIWHLFDLTPEGRGEWMPSALESLEPRDDRA
jgi:predicted dithiol-disulfide oxidoreductase (DUF899 family)